MTGKIDWPYLNYLGGPPGKFHGKVGIIIDGGRFFASWGMLVPAKPRRKKTFFTATATELV